MIKKLIAQSKKVDRKLLNRNEIEQLKEDVNIAIDYLKEILPFRHRSARRQVKGCSTVDRMDHYLAIDDILIDYDRDLWIGIDWTTNKDMKDLGKKIQNHKDLAHCHYLLGLDKSIVVLVVNEDTIPENKISKFVFRALKEIAKAATKKDFQGGMTIDAREILK